MAPSYNLTYFDGRGPAECSRFLFKYGNIDFEDFRIPVKEWPNVKAGTPYGQVPILEHNGKKVTQSVAIARYLGKTVKLAGKDDWENLEIDSVVDTVNDLRLKNGKAFREPNEEQKKILMEAVVNEFIPFYFTRLDAIVEKNKGYLALNRLTWADFYFTSVCPGFDNVVGGNVCEKYPNLQAWREKVEALPAIKKWIEVRPKTDF